MNLIVWAVSTSSLLCMNARYSLVDPLVLLVTLVIRITQVGHTLPASASTGGQGQHGLFHPTAAQPG